MPKKKVLKPKKRVLVILIFVFMLSGLSFVPASVSAADGDNGQVKVTMLSAGAKQRLHSTSRQKEYSAALKEARKIYRSDRQVANSELKQALKSAQSQADRTDAKKGYDAAMKAANAKFEASKKEILAINFM
jgi:hypothetical protein